MIQVCLNVDVSRIGVNTYFKPVKASDNVHDVSLRTTRNSNMQFSPPPLRSVPEPLQKLVSDMTFIESIDDDKNLVETMDNSEKCIFKTINGWLPTAVIKLFVNVDKDRGYLPITPVPKLPY